MPITERGRSNCPAASASDNTRSINCCPDQLKSGLTRAEQEIMRTTQCVLVTLPVIFVVVSLPVRAQQAKWQLTKTVHIGGEGGWDYVTVHPPTNRIFVTRSSHTQVIDTASGNIVADIPDQSRSHGTAIVPTVNRGFITEGGRSARHGCAGSQSSNSRWAPGRRDCRATVGTSADPAHRVC
jgi:hypothetical protein